MKRISIVIPALNEEKGISPVLAEIPVEELSSIGYETEVLVIDNGSTDGTVKLAKKTGANVIIQPVRGYGNAYKAGFANATGDIIATGDADLTYPFADIPGIIRKMEMENLDFINTNRLQLIDTSVMTGSHIFGNWLLTRMMKLLFNTPFLDSQSGMWVFKHNIWYKLDVVSSGMPFSQEIKIEAYTRGFHCGEVPIKYRMRAGKEKLNTIRDGIKVILNLFYKKLATMSEQIENATKDALAFD